MVLKMRSLNVEKKKESKLPPHTLEQHASACLYTAQQNREANYIYLPK